MSPELMETIGKGGIVALLMYMLYRAETRADNERKLNELLTRESIASSVKTEATLATLANVLTGGRRADT